MCLGQVVRVIALGDGALGGGDAGEWAVVRHGTHDLAISLLTLDVPVAVGDWLVVHSGYALERISADEARAALAVRATKPSPRASQTDVPPPTDK